MSAYRNCLPWVGERGIACLGRGRGGGVRIPVISKRQDIFDAKADIFSRAQLFKASLA